MNINCGIENLLKPTFSSLHEKKKDYTVKDNQIFRPTSNGTSNSGAFGKPPISGGSGAGTRETPKPLPRTIQTTPIGQEKPSETPAKPLEIAIHSGIDSPLFIRDL